MSSTWLIMKTHDDTQIRVRKVASYVLGAVLLLSLIIKTVMGV